MRDTFVEVSHNWLLLQSDFPLCDSFLVVSSYYFVAICHQHVFASTHITASVFAIYPSSLSLSFLFFLKKRYMYWSGQMSLYSIKICWHEPWRGKFCVAVKAMVHATMKVHLLVIRTGSKTRTQINWFLSTNQPRIIYVIGLKCYCEIKSSYVCICMCLSSTIEQFWLGLSVSSLIC